MRVGEAKNRDVGKKRARIGPDAMDYLQSSGPLMKMKNIQTQLELMVKQERILVWH